MTFYNQLVLTELLELIVKASRLSHVLDTLLAQPWAVFIWGAPGIGKSSMCVKLPSVTMLQVGGSASCSRARGHHSRDGRLGKFSKAVRPSRHFSDPKRGGQI